MAFSSASTTHRDMNMAMLESHLQNRAVQTNFNHLIMGTRPDRDRIVSECYAEGLIPPALLNAEMKEVIQTIQDRITTDCMGTVFAKFLKILCQDRSTEHLAKLVSETLHELKQSPFETSPTWLIGAGRGRNGGVAYWEEEKGTALLLPSGGWNTRPAFCGRLSGICRELAVGSQGGGGYVPQECNWEHARTSPFSSPNRSPLHNHRFPSSQESHPPQSTFPSPFKPPSKPSEVSVCSISDQTNTIPQETQLTSEPSSEEGSWVGSDDDSSDDELTVPNLGNKSVIETTKDYKTDHTTFVKRKDDHKVENGTLDEREEVEKVRKRKHRKATNSSEFNGKTSPERKKSIEELTEGLGSCTINNEANSCCEHAKLAETLSKKLQRAQEERQQVNSYALSICIKKDFLRTKMRSLKWQKIRQERMVENLKDHIKELESEHIKELESERERSRDEIFQLRTELMYMEAYFNETRAENIILREELATATYELAGRREREKASKEWFSHLERRRVRESVNEGYEAKKEKQVLCEKVERLEEQLWRFTGPAMEGGARGRRSDGRVSTSSGESSSDHDYHTSKSSSKDEIDSI